MKYLTCLIVSVLVQISTCGLQRLNIDPSDITVSGVSAGGAFASQFHVAFSSKVKGAALLACPPYYCAQNLVQEALIGCMKDPDFVVVDILTAKAEAFAALGWIDSTKNLQGSPVFVYSGTKDTEIDQGVVVKVEQFYSHFKSNILSEYVVPSEHAWINSNWGSACDFKGVPWINKCDYDVPYIPLQHIHQRTFKRELPQVDENLYEFDQSEYLSSLFGFDDTAFIYVPKNCTADSKSSERCGLHISFHGCAMTRDDIQDTYARHSGLNELAEANNLVILYPQVKKTLIPVNAYGCFDWWGYSGVNYPIKIGAQLYAVWSMVKDLTGATYQINEFLSQNDQL